MLHQFLCLRHQQTITTELKNLLLDLTERLLRQVKQPLVWHIVLVRKSSRKCKFSRLLNNATIRFKCGPAGPALGSFVVESVGFPIMMVTMGVLNILFSPFVLLLKPKKNPESQSESTPLTWFKKSSWGYARFESE